jgi:hypothetical protein
MIRHRRLCQLLSYSGVALAAFGLMLHAAPAAAEWVGLQTGVDPELLTWGTISAAIALFFSGRFLWRCPQCGGQPGPLSAEFCRQCGKPLGSAGQAINASPLGPRTADAEQARRFVRHMRRLVWLDRAHADSWKWCAGLGLIASAPLVYFFVPQDFELKSVLIGVPIVAVVLWVVAHLLYVNAKNAMLTQLKCPSCRKGLANTLAEFCPSCGLSIPDWRSAV